MLDSSEIYYFKNSSSTPAIRSLDGEMATTIEEKETIFINQAFPDLLKESDSSSSILELIYTKNDSITEKEIEKALFRQSIKKALGPDKLNFRAL